MEIEEYARKRQVRIGVENLFPLDDTGDWSLLCRPSEIFHFLLHVRDRPSIGLLLDMGHLHICANYLGFDKYEFIQRLKLEYGHKIVGIHLSENDGKIDQHKPLLPESWQLIAIEKFDLKSVPITIECRDLSRKEAVEQFKMVEHTLKGKR